MPIFWNRLYFDFFAKAMVNHYQVLGIPNYSSVREVRKAYIAQIRKYHPDVNKSPKAEELSKLLNVAKEALETEERKAIYDRQLRNYLNYGQRTTYTPPRQKPVSPEEQKRQWQEMMRQRKARSARYKAKRASDDYKDSLKYFPIQLRYGLGALVYVGGLVLLIGNPYEINFFFLFAVSIPLFIGSTVVSASAYRHISAFNDISKLPYNLEKRTMRGILVPTLLPLFIAVVLYFGNDAPEPPASSTFEQELYLKKFCSGTVDSITDRMVYYTYTVDSQSYSIRRLVGDIVKIKQLSPGSNVVIWYPSSQPHLGEVVSLEAFDISSEDL